MRAVLQRVAAARVRVDGRIVGEIGAGLLVLLGVAAGDSDKDARYLAEKTAQLRIFEDPGGKMNLSVTDSGGGVLVVSQFTLLADFGLDDFARKLVGAPESINTPSRGDWLHQGGRAFAVKLDGKAAELVSPVEGEVIEVNRELLEKPAIAGDDPYGRAWVLKVKAPNLASNLRNLLSGRLARKWMEDSREALELRLMAFSGSVLQDGGEPASDLGRTLPPGDWDRLTSEFFLT